MGSETGEGKKRYNEEVGPNLRMAILVAMMPGVKQNVPENSCMTKFMNYESVKDYVIKLYNNAITSTIAGPKISQVEEEEWWNYEANAISRGGQTKPKETAKVKDVGLVAGPNSNSSAPKKNQKERGVSLLEYFRREKEGASLDR